MRLISSLTVLLAISTGVVDAQESESRACVNHQLNKALWAFSQLNTPPNSVPYWMPGRPILGRHQIHATGASFLFGGMIVEEPVDPVLHQIEPMKIGTDRSDALSESIRWSMSYKQNWEDALQWKKFPGQSNNE